MSGLSANGAWTEDILPSARWAPFTHVHTCSRGTGVLLPSLMGNFCYYRIYKNFCNDFIFRRALCSENIIMKHYVSLINFWRVDNVLNICLFEIILSEILLYKNFTKYGITPEPVCAVLSPVPNKHTTCHTHTHQSYSVSFTYFRQ